MRDRYFRLSLAVLAATLAIVFHRLLLGDVFFWGLPLLQFYPWRDYAFELVRGGILPLWNAYNGAGAPLLANYQSALLYPFNWAGLILPLEWSTSVIAVLHLFLAGWGMWRLTGRLGASPAGCGVSALAFGITHYLVARLFTFPVITAAAWLPWIVWATLGVVSTGRRRDGAWLALFTALCLLAGHAQTAWYSLTLTGLFALWWTLAQRPILWKRLGGVIAVMAIGAGAAALQLLPTAELLGQSQRSSGVDFATAMNFSYAPARTLNFLSPVFFGTPADGSSLTAGAYFEDAVYIGLIPLISAFAAAIGWLRSRRSADASPVYRTAPFWIGIVAIAYVFALGSHTPIFPFLYEHVPTFDLFQAPVRWHLWTVFGLSVLAGIGVSAWGRGVRTRRWSRRALVAAIGAVVLLVFGSGFLGETAGVSILMRALLGIGVFAALAALLSLTQPDMTSTRYRRWALALMVVIAADLGLASWGVNPTMPGASLAALTADQAGDADQTREYWNQSAEDTLKFEQAFRFDDYRAAADQVTTVIESRLPNANLYARAPLFNNFDPLLVGHFARYRDLLEAHGDDAPALLQAAGIGAVYTADGTLIPLENGASRAWLVESVCWHETPESLEAALLDPAWQPLAQVHMLGDAGCPQVSGSAENGTVFVQDGANEVTISVNAARDSWLILADTDYPGWTASIDDRPAPIYRANGMFRAVQVSPGLHQVVFTYQPEWIAPGLLLTAVALLALLFLFRLSET